MKTEKSCFFEHLQGDDGYRWHRLLDIALQRANIVEFAVPREDWTAANLKPLMPHLEQRYSSRWRWQCKQLWATTFLRFHLTPEVKPFVRSQRNLLCWLFHHPEDPTFYCGDKTVLWTVSHHGYAYILLTEQEAKALRDQGFALSDTIEIWPPTKPRA